MKPRYAAGLALIGAILIAVVGYDIGLRQGAGTVALPPAAETAAEAPAAPAAPTDLTADQQTEVEGIIKNYLIANPEILRDAFAELQRREDAAAKAQQVAAIADNKDRLFSSSRQVVLGNPNGSATLVEFFDYNCGYCKRAHADMKKLLEEDKNLKVVLKEFPVLGPGSVEAAQVGAAVNEIAADRYAEFHDKLIGERGQVNGERALAVAEEMGLDRQKIAGMMNSDEVKATINEVYDIANKLNLTGTPSYVTPKEVIVGAVGYDALKAKIEEARCTDAANC
jgi:protein-disulfide isomerase